MCNLQAARDLFEKLTATLDPSVWRKRARTVAYVEILFHVISLLIVIGCLIYAAVVVHRVTSNLPTPSPVLKPTRDSRDDYQNYQHDAQMQLLWLVTVVYGAITCIEIWATVMLIKATRVGADPKFALERARIWRYITIVLTILAALTTGFSESLIYDAGKILFQICCIGVVSMFIAELRKTIHAANQTDGDLVPVAP